ncbi:MAG: helix-hairpin-helix domain-containing protein, partial [Candidatus Wallbacteria bacterium]|nr:helix-hairpin-helix domain-containing protein [Candidatus Wallbacteria bacterium]
MASYEIAAGNVDHESHSAGHCIKTQIVQVCTCPIYPALYIIVIFLSLLAAPAAAKIDDRIDLNLATSDHLLTLFGITEHDADNILKYRMEHQEFKRIEELVPIIGEDKFELVKYDIKVTPLESRFRDALSGYATFDQYNLDVYDPAKGGAHSQFYGKFYVSFYDAVNISLQKKKNYDDYWTELFYKQKWEYLRTVTFNIYERETREDTENTRVEPEIELFKTVDLAEERKEKADSAFDFLDEYFEGKPKQQKKKNPVTGGEFLLPDTDVNHHMQLENSKRRLYEEQAAKTRYINRDERRDTLPPRELPAEEEDKLEEVPDGPHFKKVLRQKAVVGNFWLPSVRSPLVAKSSSEHIRGLRWYYFQDEWDSSFFYGNMPIKDGKVFGCDFNMNVGKDAQMSIVGYNMIERRYNNRFPCFALSGSKQITKNTSLYMEYDHVSGKAFGVYGKVYTSLGQYSLTTTLNTTTATYKDFSQLDPYYYPSFNQFGGLLEGSFQLGYDFFQSSNLTLTVNNTRGKGNYYTQNEKAIQEYSLNFNYEPLSDWNFDVVTSVKSNNYNEDTCKNGFQFL